MQRCKIKSEINKDCTYFTRPNSSLDIAGLVSVPINMDLYDSTFFVTSSLVNLSSEIKY